VMEFRFGIDWVIKTRF